MKLQNIGQHNSEEEKINLITPTELATLKSECLFSDFSVLQFPEYKNRTINLEQHLPLFDYILEASEIAMMFFEDLMGLFEITLDVLTPGTKYVIFDYIEDCKVVDLNFYELIRALNIHLKDIISLEYSVNLEKMIEIAFDFIDTHSIFLKNLLSNFKKFKLNELKLSVIPFNEIEGAEEIKTSYYKNTDHQFEDCLLYYIMEIGDLVSDMVRELKLNFVSDEFKTVEKFKKIVEVDYKDLEMKIKKLRQSANSVIEKASFEHTDKQLRIEERLDSGENIFEFQNDDDNGKINDVKFDDEKNLKDKFENISQVKELLNEQGEHMKKLKLAEEEQNEAENNLSVKNLNDDYNSLFFFNDRSVNRIQETSFLVDNTTVSTLDNNSAQGKITPVIFLIVVGVSSLIALVFWFVYLIVKWFKKQNNDIQKHEKLVSSGFEAYCYE